MHKKGVRGLDFPAIPSSAEPAAPTTKSNPNCIVCKLIQRISLPLQNVLL
jgi:hypothetical protein